MLIQKRDTICAGKHFSVFRRAVCLVLTGLMLLQTGLLTAFAAPSASVIRSDEMRGVWISYLDWERLPADQESFKREVDKMIDRCLELKMNAVFVHVRPDADAVYPSAYFPWSRFVTGTQGQNPGYDPLAIFVKAAHNKGLQFHAWINPYRVTGYHNTWEQVSDQNPAKKWLTDADPSNDRWVLKQNGAYYFNPAIPQVRELIINGVREIAQKYTVDGIHFDDYFYPEVDNSNASRWFDKPEYDASGSSLTIAQWRRENVNELIRGVYRAVKEARPSAKFGISPEGYVDHLRSDNRLFTDIDTWLSHDGYVDYIMPQIYWGFEHQLSNGSPAPFAFENNLKTWISLVKKGHAKLYIGLAMYKAGSNARDNTGIPEWKRYDNIISRQVEAGRASGAVAGYCFYEYGSFQEDICQKEVKNLLKVFR
ncbi:family 10 glycosylhydrolase [Clostridium sp. AM42-4]|uniref:glycoside hydrolase family 10 protein n=2 Tax=unclassified Clostridium TaxID=2614128 RepID=UPI000E4F5EEB|nr:family 10 glycosylhydrolase [Clostridium sp. AM42-4]RHS88898.1 hypothetical protein DW922_04540 [Clostridium sp. AM42-4]HBM48037.1 hypothetical protein [Lachnoclostridium sp.]